MTRILRTGAAVALAACLCLAGWIDVSRILWEQQDTGFLSVVRSKDLSEMSPAMLRGAGIDAVAVPASNLASGRASSLATLRAAGLRVVLIIDGAAPVRLTADGPFAGVWVEGVLSPDDPLLRAILSSGVPLIQREFMPEALTQAEWAAGFHRLLRADEVPARELSILSRGALLSRWERALRERGIRLVVLTPIPGQDGSETLAYYASVIDTLVELGYRSGVVPVAPANPGRAIGIFLHLGICALLLLVLLELLPRLPGACMLAAAGVAAAAALGGTALAQVDAFLAALLAPTTAVLLLFARRHAGLKDGIALLALFSGMSIAGGLLIAAILAQPAFMLGIAQFRGVKAALLLPPVIGGLFALLRGGWRTLLPSARMQRVLFGTVVILALGAIAYLVVRSGNTPGWVTAAELRTRNLLEQVFTARPRFKEFLVGHPLLLLFGACGGLGIGVLRYRPFLLFFGLVGQASILNSFAHAHTPLLLTLWRTGNGLLLGLLGGVVLYLVLRAAIWIWRGGAGRLRGFRWAPNMFPPKGGRHGPGADRARDEGDPGGDRAGAPESGGGREHAGSRRADGRGVL